MKSVCSRQLFYRNRFGTRLKRTFQASVLVATGAAPPMQWDATKFAGFSDADPWLPVAGSFRNENVDSFRKDKGSLWWLYRRLIDCRRKHIALAQGSYKPLIVGGDLMLFCRELRDDRVLTALNMGPEPIAVLLPAKGFIRSRFAIVVCRPRWGRCELDFELRGNEGLLIKVDLMTTD